MADAYPHLAERRDEILGVIEREERQFNRTLEAGDGPARGRRSRASGSLLESRQLAEALLVQDLARFFIAKWIDARPLARGQHAQRASAMAGANGSACKPTIRLSRPKMVMNHGRPAATIALPGRDARKETQRRKVDHAAQVGSLEVVPVRRQVWAPPP